MHLSRDAEFLNRIANDPSVFPWISFGAASRLDASALLEDERNIFLANDFGGFLFIDKGDAVYEVHSQFLPEGRGKAALIAAREAMEFMFTQTACTALMTFCPDDNPAAMSFARMLRFKYLEPGMQLGKSGKFYAMTKESWSCR